MLKVKLAIKAVKIFFAVRRILKERKAAVGSREALEIAAWMPGDTEVNRAIAQGKPLTEVTKLVKE